MAVRATTGTCGNVRCVRIVLVFRKGRPRQKDQVSHFRFARFVYTPVFVLGSSVSGQPRLEKKAEGFVPLIIRGKTEIGGKARSDLYLGREVDSKIWENGAVWPSPCVMFARDTRMYLAELTWTHCTPARLGSLASGEAPSSRSTSNHNRGCATSAADDKHDG